MSVAVLFLLSAAAAWPQGQQVGGGVISTVAGTGTKGFSGNNGQATATAPLSRAALDASAAIGGVPARIDFLGATPGFVALSQANIVAPENAPVGDQQLVVTVGGRESNRAVITVK